VDAGVLLQAHDLVLHLQLAALKLGDPQIVGRWMGLGFVDFLLQRLVPSFELRKVRLNGHARFLLMSKVPDSQSLHQSGRKSTRFCIVQRSNADLHYRSPIKEPLIMAWTQRAKAG
jgi:hypothetical protein